MHLLRLLISGITVLRDGYVPVRVEEHRDRLLAIRNGLVPFDEIEVWRVALHQEFDEAAEKTSLPLKPDYAAANALLLDARRAWLSEYHVQVDRPVVEPLGSRQDGTVRNAV